jgi:hypothetical protein
VTRLLPVTSGKVGKSPPMGSRHSAVASVAIRQLSSPITNRSPPRGGDGTEGNTGTNAVAPDKQHNAAQDKQPHTAQRHSPCRRRGAGSHSAAPVSLRDGHTTG